MGEFELIQRYFQHALAREGVVLGNGDDCALLTPAPGMVLAVSTDMLVEGRHFVSTVPPQALGHKALAVNLSDLAAMGAEPVAFTLALALPRADENWLQGFSQGLLALADTHRCALVGGDTTAGPLNLCITVFGQVPAAQALKRSAAQPGDDIYVSGTLGDARLALEVLRGTLEAAPDAWRHARQRLERPTPRLALGQALRGVAHACADVSDGLVGDLGHILNASRVDALLHVDTLLDSAAVTDGVRALPREHALTCVLAGGDDYELVFTAPHSARDAVTKAAAASATPVTRIGEIGARTTRQAVVQCLDAAGRPLNLNLAGFDHFA
ncbi:thiamine-phosphate kinase [Hydrogenophaga aquatica]